MNGPALIIQVAGGAVGGNVAGALLKKFSLGPVGNSLVGLPGGALGGQLLGLLGLGGAAQAGGAGGLNLGSILSSVAGGGGGGGLLMAILGPIRQMVTKTS